MGVSTFGGVPRKIPSIISKLKAPTSLMGVSNTIFFVETMAIFNQQPCFA
jgi:hypothetical protein